MDIKTSEGHPPDREWAPLKWVFGFGTIKDKIVAPNLFAESACNPGRLPRAGQVA
jgi:hypothetical protein